MNGSIIFLTEVINFISLTALNNLSGIVRIHRQETVSIDNMEYLLAHFGVKFPHPSKTYRVVAAKPADGCDDLLKDAINAQQYKGKAVLVKRGGCPFVKKAENVQAAGGSVILVGSKHPYLVRMVRHIWQLFHYLFSCVKSVGC